MKRIFNDKVSPYVTLPGGETITCGGSMPVLNDSILESPKIKEMIENRTLRIEEDPASSG
jgi:hypothetical protein